MPYFSAAPAGLTRPIPPVHADIASFEFQQCLEVPTKGELEQGEGGFTAKLTRHLNEYFEMGVAPPEILKSIAKEASELVPHDAETRGLGVSGAGAREAAAEASRGMGKLREPLPNRTAGSLEPLSGRFSRNSLYSTRSAVTTGHVASRNQREIAERAPWGYQGRTTRRGSIAWTTGRRRPRQMSTTSLASSHMSSETAKSGFSSAHPNEAPFLRYFRKRDSFGEAPPPRPEVPEPHSSPEPKESESAQRRTLSEIHNDEDYMLTTFIARRHQKWKDSPAYPKRQTGPVYLSEESVRLAEEVKELAWVGSLPPSPC